MKRSITTTVLQSMKSRLTKPLIGLAPVLLSMPVPSCGGGGAPPPPPSISVTVSPSSASVQTGATLQFAATVTNSTNSSVNWEVNGKVGGDISSGTISATGFYTAPAAVTDPPTVIVTAVSRADNSRSGTATVGVTPEVLARDVWFAPDFASADFQSLFTQPDQWSIARSQVRTLKFSAIQANSSSFGCPAWQCGETRLPELINVQAFSRLKAWGIDVALETEAIQPGSCTADSNFNIAEDAIQNIQANGGTVRFIAMDEPFILGQLTVDGQNCKLTMEQSADQTKRFIQIVQDKFAYIVVGDIEPYPYFSVGQLESWISLMQSLGAQLAFFHLDVDPALVSGNVSDLVGDMQVLNTFCQAHDIPFGVLLNSLTATSDAAYYNEAIQFTQRVKSAIGKPQLSIFQSFACATGICDTPINLPENEPTIFSHTRLINDALAILDQ